MILVMRSCFEASTALEDEKDLSKVSCDMELYEIYVKGFLESCGDKLNARGDRDASYGRQGDDLCMWHPFSY